MPTNRKYTGRLSNFRSLAIFHALLFLILVVTACSGIGKKLKGEQVKMRETELIIPTYSVGEPDEIPMFYTPGNYQGAQMHIYPYAAIDSLSNVKINKKYKERIRQIWAIPSA